METPSPKPEEIRLNAISAELTRKDTSQLNAEAGLLKLCNMGATQHNFEPLLQAVAKVAFPSQEEERYPTGPRGRMETVAEKEYREAHNLYVKFGRTFNSTLE